MQMRLGSLPIPHWSSEGNLEVLTGERGGQRWQGNSLF
jgi:hypothetical protein